MKFLVKSLLALAAPVVCLFLVEGALAFLDYPAGPVKPAAHTPNMSEVRESIEFRYEFATNSQGLRYREVPLERTPGTARILALGDAYTEGWGVDAPDRFTNRLERRFMADGRQVEIINGGLSTRTAKDFARLFREVGLKYQPDAVLISIFANDLIESDTSDAEQPYASSPGIKGRVKRLLPRSFTLVDGMRQQPAEPPVRRARDFISDVTAQARRRGMSQDSIQAWLDSLPPDIVAVINSDNFHVHTVSTGLLHPNFWADTIQLEASDSDRKWQNMAHALNAIADMAADEDIEVALVYQPVHFQYDPATHSADYLAVQTGTVVKREWLQETSEGELRLQTWAAERQIPFMSLTPTFRAAVPSAEPLDFAIDGHWTEAGHAVAADGLEQWLREDDVFSVTRGAANTARRPDVALAD